MNPIALLSRWLDIRPGELRPLTLSFMGAFCAIAFLILGRSLREALYLTSFEVTTLPYITIAVAVLGLPTAGMFTAMMARIEPRAAFRVTLVLVSAGLLALWPLISLSPAAVVAFYLWTALGTLLVTSGFWVVTSEQFALREAKRLFGLIGAGGTLGAMVTGISLNYLTQSFETIELIPVLVGILALLLVFQTLLGQRAAEKTDDQHVEKEESKTSVRQGLSLVWQTPHLRTIALVVFAATIASTLLDYQFKEIAISRYTTSEGLAGFFGAFYGWTGVISLLIQVLLASRFLAVAGVAASLSVLPGILIAGSLAMLFSPGLTLITMVRGADYSLRKSLYRSVLEYLYVPVPSLLRRKTKTFIDSVVDSVAGGAGAVILFLWVTLGGLPSRYLSVFIIAFSLAFLALAYRMGQAYMRTLVARLKEGESAFADQELVEMGFDGKDLLTTTLTQFDLKEQLARAGVVLDSSQFLIPATEPRGEEQTSTTMDRISSSDPSVVEKALQEADDWQAEHVPALVRLLARSAYYERIGQILVQIGEPSLDYLNEVVQDETADFVIRRRIPRILAEYEHGKADEALLAALSAARFEVRYRSGVALVRRRSKGMATAPTDWESIIWQAIDTEVSRVRPVWELQRLLDGDEAGADDFVEERVGVRGELSLEHTFRLLSLVLDHEPVRTAFHGVLLDDASLKGISLEYLEQVMPPEILKKLWPFIGDISEHQRKKSTRSLDDVVFDLSKTGATLFVGDVEQAALKAALDTSGKRGETSGKGGKGSTEAETSSGRGKPSSVADDGKKEEAD
jgi:ATP/ADP translocase